MVASLVLLTTACVVRFEVGPSPDAAVRLFDGGAPFWAVPGSAQFSPAGRYLTYVAMSEVPDGGGASFRSGALMLRDLDTGAALVLRPSPFFTCVNANCTFREASGLVFAQNDERLFVPTIRQEGTPLQDDLSLGEVIALPSGERVPAATVDVFARILQLAPDLSWAIVGNQSYSTTPNGIGFLAPLHGVVEPVVTTCMDPRLLPRDGVTQGSLALLVLSNCGPTMRNSLQVYPMAMPSRLPPSTPTPVALQVDTGLVHNVFIRSNEVFFSFGLGLGSSFHQPIAGGTPVPIGADLLSVSPDGTLAVVGASNVGAGSTRLASVVNITTSVTEGLGMLTYFERPLPWLDAQTLMFQDPLGGVNRWAPGHAPVSVYASDDPGVRHPLVELKGRVGLVVTSLNSPLTPMLVVTDGTRSMSYNLPAVRSVAHLFAAKTQVFFGIANEWTLGSRFSLRADVQFDATGHPSPDSGFTLVPTP